MPAEWFYAVENEQKGPVSPDELAALERSGVVRPGSLVWRSGLADWQPWSTVAEEVRGESSGDLALCAFSGRMMPKSQMLKYGDHYVAIEHKDDFVQALREGRPVEALAGAGVMEFVGFWWRVLASVIDWAVKLVPNMACMIPYYVIMFTEMGTASSRSGPPGFGWSMGMVVAYLFGILGSLLLSIAYDTWMVGKYGGTVGKLALGFRVVNADGTRVSYAKAFGRWAAEVMEKVIAMVCLYGVIAIGIAVFFLVGGPTADPNNILQNVGLIILLVVISAGLGGILGSFPWLMAGWTKEKKALHDFMCGTRVVRRQQG
jgi:uncharacterized RDD family membrane protein YckC